MYLVCTAIIICVLCASPNTRLPPRHPNVLPSESGDTKHVYSAEKRVRLLINPFLSLGVFYA